MKSFKILSRKTNTTAQFFTNLFISHCSLICSSIFSHPLYFSYFIFFSPYFLNLLYFLWPLFVTISLVAFALSASSNDEPKGDDDDDECDNNDDDVYRYVEVEAYRVLFEGASYEEVEDDPVEELKFTVFEDVKCSFQEDPVEIITPSSGFADEIAVVDKCCVDDFAKDVDVDEMDESTIYGVPNEEEVIESSLDLVQVQDKAELIMAVLNASDADQCSLGNRENARSFSTKTAGWTKQDDAKLGSTYGSMRVLDDKEWKRTLACKLYEERNNAGGGGEEGMDSLWEETYEPADTSKGHHPAAEKTTKNGGIGIINENGDEEEELAVQLCCLQALKISSGKMNLGIKKLSLLRFSKALKGLGWLHSASISGSSTSSKNGKKAGRN